jgi:hypothetical protein
VLLVAFALVNLFANRKPLAPSRGVVSPLAEDGLKALANQQEILA